MMSKSTVITTNLVALLICASLLSGHCSAYEDEGFQLWTTDSVSLKINEDWTAKFEEEFKFGDDGGNLYYRHSDLGFTYRGLADWIKVGFNFRQAFQKDNAGDWQEENRSHFHITLKTHLFDLYVRNRSRFEYRDRENDKDVWRYRNKVTVRFPLELTRLRLQPYFADEVFINFDKEDFYRNRLYAGLSLKFSEHIKGEAYYLWQSTESGGAWKDIDALGFNIKIYF